MIFATQCLSKKVLRFLLCLVVGGFIATTSAATIYVDITAGGANNGTSWANAFTDLQPALDAAVNGDQIWVAAGTYLPTVEFDADGSGGGDVRERTFYIDTDDIEVFGGFAGGETSVAARNPTANLTILSGDFGADDGTAGAPGTIGFTLTNNVENAYHVVTIDGTTANGDITNSTVLSGFQIGGGNADGGVFPNDSGGGLLNVGNSGGDECSPTIIDCNFLHNNAADDGGAMFNQGQSNGNSHPIITNCSFSQNTAGDEGGAIDNHGFNGHSNPTITNCVFSQNIAGQEGGAMYNNGNAGGDSNPTITNCVFSQNIAGLDGGAIFNYGRVSGNSNPIITNCVFSQNTADEGGAIYNDSRTSNGMSSPIITNCSFSQNTATTNGGAMYNDGRLTGISNPLIQNSIFWGAGAGSDLIFNDSGTGSMRYSIYDDGTVNGTFTIPAGMANNGNNSEQDPMFTNAAAGDLSLQAGSPAIDSGNSGLNSTTTDLAGNPRKAFAIDFGAFEFLPQIVPPIGSSSIPTLSEWGMILLVLLMMIATGLLYTFERKATLHLNPITKPLKANWPVPDYTTWKLMGKYPIPFDIGYLLRIMPFIALSLIVIFATATAYFGYTLTTADPFGIVLTIPLLSYLWFLIHKVVK